MDKENIAAAIIMAVVCFGCGALFFGIGGWMDKAKKPVNFWSDVQVPVEKVSDVPAYNHANAVMWKGYSIVYGIAGVFGCLGVFSETFSVVAAILLFAACFPGIFLLIRRYRQIEQQYIIR